MTRIKSALMVCERNTRTTIHFLRIDNPPESVDILKVGTFDGKPARDSARRKNKLVVAEGVFAGV